MAEKRKYTRYVTNELWEAVNPRNKELLDKFIMGKRKLSESSRAGYINDFQSFFVYLLKNHENKYLFDYEVETAAEIIDDYISFCLSVLGNSERRASRRTSSISSLYIFYKKRRLVKENPIELLERIRGTQGQYVADHVFLTAEQVEAIRERLRRKPNTQLELYFELGLFTMARVSALASMQLDQVNLEKKIIIGVREKEGYIVNFFISTKVKDLIVKWIGERESKEIFSDLLFCTRTGGNAKSMMQGAYTRKLSEYAGVKGVTPHALRRTGADLRKKAGLSLETVSKLLNHKSTGVTQASYLQENIEKLREEIEGIDI